MRESSPSGGGLGNRSEWQTRVRPDEERHLVETGLAGITLAQLGDELAFAQADSDELARHLLCETRGRLAPRGAKLLGKSADITLSGRQRFGRGRGRVEAVLDRFQLRPRLGCAGQQLFVGLRAEASLGLSNPVQSGLDLFEPSRLGLERRQKATQLARGLAQAQLDVAQLVTGSRKLRRELFERRECPLGASDEPGGALALVRSERLGCFCGSVRELGDMTKTLPLAAKTLFPIRLEPGSVFDERAQLGEPRVGGRGTLLKLLVPTSCCGELAPGEARLGSPPKLVGSDERVEDIELVAGTRETTLLELPGHRDQPLPCRSQILACGAAPPGVRTRAPVGEHAPRNEEPFLVLGAKLGERGELVLFDQPCRQIELGLDVRLGPVGADVAGVTLGAEEQADRLGENRLARPGLAGDRVEPWSERELGLLDQDEVLDAEAAKHGCRRDGRRPSGAAPSSTRSTPLRGTRV